MVYLQTADTDSTPMILTMLVFMKHFTMKSPDYFLLYCRFTYYDAVYMLHLSFTALNVTL